MNDNKKTEAETAPPDSNDAEAKSPAKPAAKSKSKKTKAKAPKRGPRRPTKAYPSISLETALKIAYEIKDKNGGNPWSPDQVAAAVGRGAKTAEFFYLTAASRDYGLTTGTRDT